jgi:hypothetical protein
MRAVCVLIAVASVGCGGGAGRGAGVVNTAPAPSTLAIADAITLPTDPTAIKYPDDYQNAIATTVNVADPYCSIKSSTVSFPKSWLGAFPLPAISGAPLPSTVLRGLHLKDYWVYGLHDASTNPGCTGDIHDAYRETLRRAKLLGVDHIGFYQDAWPVDASATPPVFDVNISEIPPAEIAFIVAEAKAQGLAVHEYMQINPGDHKGAQLPAGTIPSSDWASKFLDSYTDFIVGQAAYAQQLGIDAFQLDWGAYFLEWNPPGHPEYAALLNQKMAIAAQKVRAVYSGKIIYGTLEAFVQADASVFANVDWQLVDLYGVTLTATENDAISVELLKAKYVAFIHSIHQLYRKFARPAVFRLYVQSHRNYLRDGWVEDGFCVPSAQNCSQLSLTTDFSVQAIATEAMLEAIDTQKDYSLAAVASQAWFYADVIMPKSAQPNLSQSPRDKPAEVITYRWYSR